jgi:hypothetical protein
MNEDLEELLLMLKETESIHDNLLPYCLRAADVSIQKHDASSPSSLAQALQHQVDLGFQRRDASHVKNAFDKHCDLHSASISDSRLHSVLIELGLDIDQQRATELFDEFDTDSSEGLSFLELQQLLHKPSRLHEWAKGLPLHELLADAIPRKPGTDPLRVVSRLTDGERVAVCEAVRNGLERMLKESSELLEKAFSVSDQRKNAIDGSKFNIVPVSCGNVNDFHAGVEGRIGKNIRTVAYICLCALIIPNVLLQALQA